MLKEISLDAEMRMKKTVETLSHDLAKLKTGRAHPSLLEDISVSYYDVPTPLNQVASILVEDSRTLAVTPWEKSNIQAIDKAIRASDLGLNPVVTGQLIRVPLPPLTEARRKEWVKHVRSEAEDARVSVRNIRRDANTHFKDLVKAKKISEDEERRAQDGIQKLTDKAILELEKILSGKEAELMMV